MTAGPCIPVIILSVISDMRERGPEELEVSMGSYFVSKYSLTTVSAQ